MSKDLLPKLKALGIRLSTLGNDLEITAPDELLTDNLLTELKTNKHSIMRELRLADFQSKAENSNSLAELFAVLKDFGQYKWHICERSDMSTAYTPIALKLIQHEKVDKWKTLEELAYL